jgi:alpha-1,2-mannosyltransferase
MGQSSVLRWFLVALASTLAIYNLGRSFMGPKHGRDFVQYYASGRALLDGRPDMVYAGGPDYQQYVESLGIARPTEFDGRTLPHMTNAYPPFVAVMAMPLALMPFGLARDLFFAMGLAAAALSVWLLFADRPPGQRRAMILAGLAGTALFFPTYSSLYMGQVNSLLVLLLIAALALSRKNRQWSAGAAVGLAGAIKVFPFIMVVWFLITRRYRAAIGAVLACAAVVAVSLIWVDLRLYGQYLTEVFPAKSMSQATRLSQGLFGLFYRLLTPGNSVQPIADMPLLAGILAIGSAAGCILATILVVRRAARDEKSTDLGFALFLVAAILATPKSWDHYGVFLLPAYLLLFEAFAREAQAWPRWLVLASAVSYCGWAFILTTAAELSQLPTGVLFQPAWSVKCISTLLLWGCTARVLGRLTGQTSPREKGVSTPPCKQA